MGFFDFLKKSSANQTDPGLSFPQEQKSTPITTPEEPEATTEVKTEEFASDPTELPSKDDVNKQLEESVETEKSVEDFSAEKGPKESELGESIEFEGGEDMTEVDEVSPADSDESTDTDSSFDAE